MVEEASGGKRETLSSAQRAETYLGNQAVPVWGGGVSSDFYNAVGTLLTECRHERLWPTIEPVPTIEEYVREYIGRTRAADNPEVATAVIERINPEFLTKANAIISEMNSIIKARVTSREQADALLKKLKVFSDWLYKREG